MGKITAVLFDLGGTLAEYYAREEFPALRDEGIARAAGILRSQGASLPDAAELQRRVTQEDHEAPDCRVRPLERRFTTIFREAAAALDAGTLDVMCREFLQPIFTRAVVYPDAVPVLGELRRRGYRVGLASNTSWGSPAELWREELDRLGLSSLLDCAVFCRDVGWRKPAAAIFLRACELLDADPAACLFAGDHPRWDVAGAQAAGMRAVLLQRGRKDAGSAVPGAVASLAELPGMLSL